MALTCAFKWDRSPLAAYDKFLELREQPLIFQRDLTALKELLEVARLEVESLAALKLKPGVAEKAAEDDDEYIDLNLRLIESERHLVALQKALVTLTNQSSGFFSGIKNAFKDLGNLRGLYKGMQGSETEVVQADSLKDQIVVAKMELQEISAQAARLLSVATERARTLFEQRLRERNRSLMDRFYEAALNLKDFEQELNELWDMFGAARTKLDGLIAAQEKLIADLCATFNSQLKGTDVPVKSVAADVPMIDQRDADYFSKILALLGKVEIKVPDNSSGLTRCTPDAQDEKEQQFTCPGGVTNLPALAVTGKPALTDYQKMVAELGHMNVKGRYLIDWQPGTGKTCAIKVVVQMFVKDLDQHRPGNLPRGSVLFVHEHTHVERYYKMFKEDDYCKIDSWSDEIGVQAKLFESKQDSFAKITFVNKADKTELLVLKIQRLSVKPQGELWKSRHGLPPPEGLVLVDEAHFMFDPSELAARGHPREYVEWLLNKLFEELKVMLFTGTPSAHAAKIENILRMIAYFHGKLENGKYLYNLTFEEIVSKWTFDKPVHIKRRKQLQDELFKTLHVPATKVKKPKKSSKKSGTSEEEELDEDQPLVEWLPGKREEFIRYAAPHVSFLTLENDPGVFPHVKLPPNLNKIAPDTPPLPTELRKPAAVLAFARGKGFTFQRYEEAVEQPYLLVQVNLGAGFKKVESQQAHLRQGTSFTKTAVTGYNPDPIKWDAADAFIDTQPENTGFFIIGPAKRIQGAAGFAAEKLHKKRKMKQFSIKVTKKDELWKDDPNAWVEKQYKEHLATPGKRYIVLDKKERENDKGLYNKYLAIFNHRCNANHQYIQMVLGDLTAGTGLDVFNVHFNMMLEPPSSKLSYMQIKARITRFCGFRRSSSSINEWWTIPVLFESVGPNGEPGAERSRVLSITQPPSTPMDLLNQALQQAAFDCKLMSPLTGVTCFGEEAKIASREIEDKLVQCTAPTGEEREIKLAECRGFVDFGAYDLWDEIVVTMLQDMTSESARTVEQMGSVDPDVNFELLKAVWATNEPLRPFIRMDPRPRPEALIKWIMQADGDYLGTVFVWFRNFMLSRRARVDTAMLSKMTPLALAYTAAFHESTNTHVLSEVRADQDRIHAKIGQVADARERVRLDDVHAQVEDIKRTFA